MQDAPDNAIHLTTRAEWRTWLALNWPACPFVQYQLLLRGDPVHAHSAYTLADMSSLTLSLFSER